MTSSRVDKKIHLYDPVPAVCKADHNQLEELGYNWFNANVDEALQLEMKTAKKHTNKVFNQIPNDKVKTSRPWYGQAYSNKPTGVPDGGYTRGWLRFGEGSSKEGLYAAYSTIDDYFTPLEPWNASENNPQNFGRTYEWYGFMNNSSYCYSWGWDLYNKGDDVYPFPVKGVYMRISMPPHGAEYTVCGHCSDNNYGDKMQINKVHGLWRDKNGFYYIYDMYSRGMRGALPAHPRWAYEDTSAKPDVVPAADNYENKFPFIDTSEDRTGSISNHPRWRENGLTYGEVGTLAAWSNRKDIEHMYFVGVSMQIYFRKAESSKRCRTWQFGSLNPIPFHVEPDRRHKMVVGKPTHFTTAHKDRKIKTTNETVYQ